MVSIIKFASHKLLNNLVEIEAVEKQTKEVQIVPSRAIGNSTMTRKNTTLNKVIRKQQRYGVISANLLHTNLAILHYTGDFSPDVGEQTNISCYLGSDNFCEIVLSCNKPNLVFYFEFYTIDTMTPFCGNLTSRLHRNCLYFSRLFIFSISFQ